MMPVFASVAALLFGVVLLVSAQGFFLVLIPLSLSGSGLSAQAVGVVVTAYFAGFVFGAWYSSRLIFSVGHVRTYGGLIAVVLVAVLSLPLTSGVVSWAVLRFIHGAAVSGVFVAVESWLNAAAPSRWRGRVLGTYTFLTLAALGGGQFLLNTYGTTGFAPFNFGAILFALSILPVVLSKAPAPPTPPVEVRLNWQMTRRIPLGLAVGAAGGLLTGSFWALAPLFAATLFEGTSGVTFLIGIALLGGILLQWPIGYLSDRRDRRLVILGVAVLGAAASAGIVFIDGDYRVLVHAGVAIYGGTIFALHPLALSHAADHAGTSEETLSISQGLILANGIGLAAGPILAGVVGAFAGRDSPFIFGLGVHSTIAAVILWRMHRRAAVPAEEKSTFMPAVQTTPAQLSLDPRMAVSTDGETPPAGGPPS